MRLPAGSPQGPGARGQGEGGRDQASAAGSRFRHERHEPRLAAISSWPHLTHLVNLNTCLPPFGHSPAALFSAISWPARTSAKGAICIRMCTCMCMYMHVYARTSAKGATSKAKECVASCAREMASPARPLPSPSSLPHSFLFPPAPSPPSPSSPNPLPASDLSRTLSLAAFGAAPKLPVVRAALGALARVRLHR